MAQDVAIAITPQTLETILAGRPELTEITLTRTPSVFVIFDCDCVGERTQILPEGAFKVMFEEDPSSLTNWKFVTARIA
jgi:hypothetical protein